MLKTTELFGQFFGYHAPASLAVPQFFEKFDPERGTITNPEIDEQFRAALLTLATAQSVAAA